MSEKPSASGDVLASRAVVQDHLRQVTAVTFVVAHISLFVKSFPDPVTGKFPLFQLIYIAVISLGPIVWYAALKFGICLHCSSLWVS